LSFNRLFTTPGPTLHEYCLDNPEDNEGNKDGTPNCNQDRDNLFSFCFGTDKVILYRWRLLDTSTFEGNFRRQEMIAIAVIICVKLKLIRGFLNNDHGGIIQYESDRFHLVLLSDQADSESPTNINSTTITKISS